MLKFKVVGFSLILMYSFFLNTINCSSTVYPEGGTPSLSQIRQLEHDSREEILPIEAGGEREVFIQTTTPHSSMPLHTHTLQYDSREEKEYLRGGKPHYYRGVALEENRVLRI